MEFEAMPRKLWEHPDPQSTAMWKFMQTANRRHGLQMSSFQELYAWSCHQRSAFFEMVWETFPLVHEGTYERVVDEAAGITSLPRWFEGVRLNFAENLLFTAAGDGKSGGRSTEHKEDDAMAVTAVREGNARGETQQVTWGQLRRQTLELAAAMRARGVRRGDRVVVVGAHSATTLVVLLATTWLGALFSSSSTDMGVEGILQRTVQISPRLVFFDDGAVYNGKVVDLRDKMEGVARGMASVEGFQGVVAVQRFADRPLDTSHLGAQRVERLEGFLAAAQGRRDPAPVRVGFQEAAMVYYSSGTSGTPKAIVHGVGPLLLSLTKEARLHRGTDHGDVGLQYTTTGWIMYLSSVAQLLPGSRVVLYDGSPLVPDARVLLRVAEEQRVTALGISPRWLAELRRRGVVPRRDFDLSALRTVTSTGMVLSEQLFEWFYDDAFPPAVHLCNISGGTDIAGCFAIDNPLTPVYVGGCQGPSLGNQIAIYDHDLADGAQSAAPLPAGVPGDLVATAAFPNVPLFLWGDGDGDDAAASAPGPKYTAAYFARFAGVWAQGDFCAIHPRTGGILMLGRSDGVLNPSGVRFGSGDIYGVVERWFAAHVADSICVGQRRPGRDDDESVVLFLLMKDGVSLDAALVAQLRKRIASELTKRHVPKYIFEVPEIPTTVNGKKVELPVKQIISGKTVKPSGTLLNPKSLDFFYRFQDIEKLLARTAKL